MLILGEIERMDTVYINGKDVGGSAWVENPRVYFLRDGALKAGRNVIAIRVLKTKPDGGFLSKPEDLHLALGDKSSIPLAGEWKAKISVDARPPQPLPIAYENWPVMPTVLYEGMLAPVAPLSITGAIWYQGEQNSPRGYQYRKILPAMIADWRKLFAQGDFPFYIVSLPAVQKRSPTPGRWRRVDRDARVAGHHRGHRSQLLPGRHHRHRRPGQHPRQRQAAGRRSPGPLRAGQILRQDTSSTRARRSSPWSGCRAPFACTLRTPTAAWW